MKPGAWDPGDCLDMADWSCARKISLSGGEEFRHRYVAPEGNHACGRRSYCRMAGAASHSQDGEPALLRHSTCYAPWPRSLTIVHTFSRKFKLSEVPISMGQEDGSRNRRTSMFFPFLSNTWVRILDTVRLGSSMCSWHTRDKYYLPRPLTVTWWDILMQLENPTDKVKLWPGPVVGLCFKKSMPYAVIFWPRTFLCGKWRCQIGSLQGRDDGNRTYSIISYLYFSLHVCLIWVSNLLPHFEEMTSGPTLITLFPGIVSDISDIPDQNGNEQKLLNAGRIPYPVFTVSASVKTLHELVMNFHGAGYYRSSVWGSRLNSRSKDRYTLATSSATLSWWFFFTFWPCMSLRSHWYTSCFHSKDFLDRSSSSRPLIQVDYNRGLQSCEFCTGNHALLFVSHLDCGDFSEVLVLGPIQASHTTNLLENYIILLVCGGVYGNNLDLYGQRSLHRLSGLWGPDRYHKFG